LEKWTLGINNHSMYFRDQGLRRHLDLGDEPKSIVSGLLGLSRRVASSTGDTVRPAVQFGAESEFIFEERSLLEHLRRESSRRGVEPIPHHPDPLTPGRPGFVSSLQLALQRAGYLGSSWIVVHPSPDSSSLALRETVFDLSADVLIRELRRSKVGIALENLGPGRDPPYLGDLEALSSAIREIQEAYATKGGEALASRIGMCLDYGHLFAFESRVGGRLGALVEMAEEITEQVVAMHIHINDGSGDQHILLGERPDSVNRQVLEESEKLLLEEIVPMMDHCNLFVMERNTPYEVEDLSFAAGLLASSFAMGEGKR